MRNYLSVFLVFVSLSTVFSQKHTIGINTGTAWSKTTKSDAQERKLLSILPTFNLSYQYHFENKWFLETGLGYQMLGFRGDEDWKYYPNQPDENLISSYFGNPSVISTYLTLPLSIGKTYGDKLFYQPKIGLVLGKLQRSDMYYYQSYGDELVFKLRNYDLSLLIEQSLGFKFSNKFSSVLNLKFQHGMIDYIPFAPFKDNLDLHRTLFLTLGLQYGLSKSDKKQGI